MSGVRVALDAMGGDHAPAATVAGALAATRADADLTVALFGERVALEAELKRAGADADGLLERLPIVATTQVVGSGDAPKLALRLADSSIRRSAEALAAGEVGALVAAGNTGAAVAAATLIVGLIPGVRRPGIGVILPTAGGPVVLCDAGANIHCKPLHLYHYAVLASRYAERALERPQPSVGLLNIGSEEGKGTELVRETAALIARSDLNSIGHVEGNDIFAGKADVVVCEGFVGNTILKTAEGLYEVISVRMKELVGGAQKALAAAGGDPGPAGPISQAVNRFQERLDWGEHGGAPLLGVRAPVLISHGRSDQRAIANALHQAARLVRSDTQGAMAAGIAAQPAAQPGEQNEARESDRTS